MINETIGDKKGFDDPLWEYILRQRLEPYIPYVRKWWAEVDSLSPYDTGVIELFYDDNQPPGLYQRFTRTAVRSPIRGVQAFPFIIAAVLQISGVSGGSTKMVQKLLGNKDFVMEEFSCLELHNLPSVFNQGQLIAFVPTEIYGDTKMLGKWIYLTNAEISSLIQGVITDSVHNKAIIKG
jgi:hypothetical protein